MPVRALPRRSLQLEAEIEEAFLVCHRLDLVPAVGGAHPRMGDLRAQETPGHASQVATSGVAGARRREPYGLQGAAFEKERIRRTVAAVRQDLDRPQPSHPPLEGELEPVEPRLQGASNRDKVTFPAPQTVPPRATRQTESTMRLYYAPTVSPVLQTRFRSPCVITPPETALPTIVITLRHDGPDATSISGHRARVPDTENRTGAPQPSPAPAEAPPI